MEISSIPEYERDLKGYTKKYRTIMDDVGEVIKVLKIRPDESPPFSFRIEGLGINTCVIKVRKIACKSLKGRGVQSGFRLVYAWFPNEERIVLAELYHKAEKETEDRDRIFRHFR